MSGIRGKDTKPEMQLRKFLHAAGFRYRLHVQALPGKPDLVLSRHRAVIFVHGCFWHGHHCRYFKWPKTRSEFWQEKISRNQQRDQLQWSQLQREGWRTLIVWECATRPAGPKHWASLTAQWLRNDSPAAFIDEQGLHEQHV